MTAHASLIGNWLIFAEAVCLCPFFEGIWYENSALNIAQVLFKTCHRGEERNLPYLTAVMILIACRYHDLGRRRQMERRKRLHIGREALKVTMTIKVKKVLSQLELLADRLGMARVSQGPQESVPEALCSRLRPRVRRINQDKELDTTFENKQS